MKQFINFSFFILILVVSLYSQNGEVTKSPKQAKMEGSYLQNSGITKSSKQLEKLSNVQIDYVCQNKTRVRLRVHNSTEWAIAVDTFSMYSYPNNSGKFNSLLLNGRKQIALSNGLIVTTPPNDREIDSLLYFVVEESIIENKKYFSKKVYGNVGAATFIAPQDSFIFSVSIKNLHNSSEVYVNYHYEWEYKGLRLDSLAPEHRVSFRGLKLSNLGQKNCE